MKKLFIIIISIILLAVGVYYLSSNNNIKTNNQTTNVPNAKDSVSGGQIKKPAPQPMLRQVPSGSTRTS